MSLPRPLMSRRTVPLPPATSSSKMDSSTIMAPSISPGILLGGGIMASRTPSDDEYLRLRVLEATRCIQDALDKANEEVHKQKQRADKMEQELNDEKQKTQPTTLKEFLETCHNKMFSQLCVETDKTITTKGMTNVRDKWCPSKIEEWTDFAEVKKTVFKTLHSLFSADMRVFDDVHHLRKLGDKFHQRKIANERSLEFFLHLTVEGPISAIISELKKHPDICKAFGIRDGIDFQNHPHAISEVAEEVLNRKVTPVAPSTPEKQPNLRKLAADQICVYKSSTSERSILYVCEYKPPHKLTTSHLRSGLRPMNIYEEVINQHKIPNKETAKFRHQAEYITAAAITQTYSYMIEGGLDYGLLTTGEAIVFLSINWDQDGTLRYHLAEPGRDVQAADKDDWYLSTAVSQYLAFTLHALEHGKLRGHSKREKVKQKLRRWATDSELAVGSTPSQRGSPPEESPYSGTRARLSFKRAPIDTRSRTRKMAGMSCRENLPEGYHHEGSSDEEDGSPSRPPAANSGSRSRGASTKEADAGVDPQEDRPYCTQRCLLGLVKGQKLHKACPNVDLHGRGSDYHPVSHKQWLVMLYRQVKRSLDDGIKPLHIGGARGVMFKITLLKYGYTFMSKGTIKTYIPDLEHEAAVYKRLLPVQGKHVPVFLGSLDLRQWDKIYYYDFRVYIVHLTFMSWGGLRITDATGITTNELRAAATKSLQALHHLGVFHNDVRAPNMLFNEETGDIMMIDFERSKLVTETSVVPAKRARVAGKGKGKGVKPKRMRYNMEWSRCSGEVQEAEYLFE